MKSARRGGDLDQPVHAATTAPHSQRGAVDLGERHQPSARSLCVRNGLRNGATLLVLEDVEFGLTTSDTLPPP